MELPNEIMNKIMLCISHPLADLFKDKFELKLRMFKSKNPCLLHLPHACTRSSCARI